MHTSFPIPSKKATYLQKKAIKDGTLTIRYGFTHIQISVYDNVSTSESAGGS